MRAGTVIFMLHSHLPYFRKVGSRLSGEEWLFEAMAESYIPLLNLLHRLSREERPVRLNLGFTPILLEQLADEYIKERFIEYLKKKIRAASYDIIKFGLARRQDMLALALEAKKWYTETLQDFSERYNGDLVGAFRFLQEQGYVEITTSAATHSYLPLLSRQSAVNAQVAVGVAAYRRYFGRRPRGFWLPECAYRPGLETALERHGLQYFFVDTHTIEGGGSAATAVSSGGEWEPERTAPTGLTTYLPYRVRGSQVVALGRNQRTGLQVWSADYGYPGDGWYREFHKKEFDSGLKYWRVTDRRAGLGEKELYQPARAQERVVAHAGHFTWLVESLLAEFKAATGQPGVLVACYDTELFGHWWFEGAAWLEEVLRRLSRSSRVALETAGRYLDCAPPLQEVELPESSWGLGGKHHVWFNPATEWLWPLLYEVQEEMEALARKFPQAEGVRRRILNQAAREVLLIQSSDWPFLITTGQAADYASTRFQEHVQRFRALAALAQQEEIDPLQTAFLAELEESDYLFPELDYTVFAQP